MRCLATTSWFEADQVSILSAFWFHLPFGNEMFLFFARLKNSRRRATNFYYRYTSMSLFAQLVCSGCTKILTYSLGAVSARCTECGSVTPAQLMSIDCPECHREIVAPINTIELLCPVCATTTLIPAELLPRVGTPFEENAAAQAAAGNAQTVSMLIRNPAPNRTGAVNQTSVSVATLIDPEADAKAAAAAATKKNKKK